jgi:adenylate cyclase
VQPAPGSLLVVDDTIMNRDLLARMLTQQGHQVDVAINGREALEMIRTQPFDLILLDIMMPEVNGFQVLEALKADPVLRHLPVIVISAVGDLDSIARCIKLGAEDHLAKPFNPVILKARINACLEKKRLRDQEESYLLEVQREKQRADDLLRVILPESVVEELKATNSVKPRLHENVAVLFCDIEGFTTYCEQHHPDEVVTHLQQLVVVYEELTTRYQMQKIKTIGDAFMATAGLLTPVENPVLNCVRCGLEMICAAQKLEWHVRVGVHVGPVMAGVVGHKQYLYDIWGDTVNTAARIERLGPVDAVSVSDVAWAQIATVCEGESLGVFQAKGKGELELFRVDTCEG